MSLTLYNSLTKQEETFEADAKGEVSMYTCGPTVYGRPHIGNYSSFLMADLLRRWLEAGHGYKVTHVKNITDVGHLVADGDDGEDKVEKQAREESGEVTHDSVIAVARKYERQYLEDERALNMVEPEHRPRATDHIEGMKGMIDALLNMDIAYVTDDGIYFDITKVEDYGKLSGNTVENLCAGARVGVNDQKRCPADFALWKFCTGHNEHHVLRWPSPGTDNPDGFPGWHIECSAMSRSLLGDQIDIHTGGEDNIFPHHECEIAQSECVTDAKPFVKHWLHRRRIDMGDRKMSKSLGNVLSVDDIQEMGYDPLDLRYLFLSVHYRTQLKFNEKGLDDAKKARRKITQWMQEPHAGATTEGAVVMSSEDVTRFVEAFHAAMDDDLNTPAALATVFDLMSELRKKPARSTLAKHQVSEFIELIRDTFGCFEGAQESVPDEVMALLERREEARANKDFALSDRLRDEIKEHGFEVRDGSDGQAVTRL